MSGRLDGAGSITAISYGKIPAGGGLTMSMGSKVGRPEHFNCFHFHVKKWQPSRHSSPLENQGEQAGDLIWPESLRVDTFNRLMYGYTAAPGRSLAWYLAKENTNHSSSTRVNSFHNASQVLVRPTSMKKLSWARTVP